MARSPLEQRSGLRCCRQRRTRREGWRSRKSGAGLLDGVAAPAADVDVDLDLDSTSVVAAAAHDIDAAATRLHIDSEQQLAPVPAPERFGNTLNSFHANKNGKTAR